MPSTATLADLSTSADVAAEPLTLTTTEQFLLGCDCGRGELVIRVRMHLTGQPDRPCLREAWELAVARHRLFRCVLAWDEAARLPCWEPIDSPPPLRFTGEPDVAWPQLDLLQSPGLRASVATDEPDVTTIDIDFHHAVCDGQGARQFLLDWFAAYTALLADGQPRLVRLEPERLLTRGTIVNPPGVHPPGLAEGFGNLWATVRGRTVRLPTDGQPGRFESLRLGEDRTEQVRRAMREARCTANDLGIALTLAGLEELRPSSRRLDPLRRWHTVANPVDLRKPSDRRLPACNRIGFAFVRRRTGRVSFADLLASVQTQMRYVKDGYIGAEFIRGLDLVQPGGWVERFRRMGWFVPTAQFTCLGDTTRGTRHGFVRDDRGALLFGSMRLDGISGFAPCGPAVPVSIGQCETASEMTFTVVTRGYPTEPVLAAIDRQLTAFTRRR